MAHASHHHKIEPPGEMEIPKWVYTTAIVFIIVGLVAFAAGLFTNPERAWRGYVIGFWFAFSLALSGPFFVATQYLARAGWSVSIRRIPEAFGTFLYPAVIFGIIGLFGIDYLFGWLNPDVFDPNSDSFDPIVNQKSLVLNRAGIWIATLASTVVLAGLHFLLRKNSLDQDEDGDPQRTIKATWLSAAFVIAFVLGVSFMSWYWLMTYDPHWYSTMLSVYAFAGLFQTGLCVMAIILIFMLKHDKFGETVGMQHLHDVGKLVFAFTVFNAYIAFSQYLLLWYAQIPETIKYYADRTTEGWGIFLLILPFVKFIIPFLFLLPQASKKNKGNVLLYMCILMIGAQFLEIWLWVMPYWYGMGGLMAPMAPIFELPIWLGFFGLFVVFTAKSFAKHPLVPLKDPYLNESIPHSHDHLIYPNAKPADSDSDS